MKAKAQLRQYGINPNNILTLGANGTPALLDYLDLIEPRRQHPLLPDGVAEVMGRPLLFFVDESQLGVSVDPATHHRHLKHLRQRVLASRGERVYLARVLPGELRVVPVSLEEQTPEWKIFRAGTGEASVFFSNLTLGKYEGRGDSEIPDYLFHEMFGLLMSAAEDLARNLKRGEVLSLLGRALFFRFLRDRQIIKDDSKSAIAPNSADLSGCFESSENAAATSKWLDFTFNGDFLPLPEEGDQAYFDSIGRNTNGRVFNHLSAILRGGKPVSSSHYQLRFDWGDFDFAHVPVGLLSQVYEAFCWSWEQHSARETSVYYTPRNIAKTLIDEAFEKVPNAATSRLLDPACGAGIFLVLAFRRIYREQWQSTSRRPNTRAIRGILEKQLTGFDISDSALKLSALSLYLTAIELDPEPVPVEKLKFKRLRDSVLFNFRRPNEPDQGMVIGSLGQHVGANFDAQFDLILSNPPWTSLSRQEKTLATEFTEITRDIIRRKGEPSLAEKYINPDFAPDLPFLWKSTEWCKPNGRIAMALPARLLLKQQDIPRAARETIFRMVEITGIINGSNLSDTNVWPKMQQPFILLFACNRRPKANHIVKFITPLCDTILNQRGEVRIDSKSAQPVEFDASLKDAWLWKALAVGTSLDVEIIRKLEVTNSRPLKSYWEKDLGLISRNGYQIRENQTQRDSSFLRGLPDLNTTDLFRFVVEPEQLSTFQRDKICWPRKREVYKAPLTLVLESPGVSRVNGWALLSFSDVAYNESFYGYSAAGHPDGECLARYLHLFVHSLVWMHFALLTSPKFGAERRKFYKSVLDDCPIVPFERLTVNQKQAVLSLSRRLEQADPTVFTEIDEFFGDIYGLDHLDLEVIRDTVEVCLPYDQVRERACRPPTHHEREVFRERVQSLVRPFFRVLGKEPEVTTWEPIDRYLADNSPFSVLLVGEHGRPTPPPEELFQNDILPLANQTGATRILLQVDDGLVVGILNQYRYWTPSRARLLSAELLRQHAEVFER